MSIKTAGADDVDEFSRMIESGEELIGPDRVKFHTLWREGDWDPSYKWYANWMRNIDNYDHQFFKRSPREAANMDPAQRLSMQAAYQAVEKSGYFSCDENPAMEKTQDQIDPNHVGVYVGVTVDDYQNHVRSHRANAFSITGTMRSLIAGKIAHHFGWAGPSLTVDTACSSSAVAIHTACRDLLAGDCNAALAGGSDVITDPLAFQDLAAAGFLSPSGQCKPFDDRADGYCRGEAVGFVFLKRLSDALADGNQIFGCISSSAVYQNENHTPIFVPNSPSLSNIFKHVMRKSQVQPSDISVVECHGTGTPVGDPAEWESVRHALDGPDRVDPVYVGSAKGHVGHTEAASGVVALVKVLTMMQSGYIPPQASYSKLSHLIQPTDMMHVANSQRPWQSTHKTALINNYGASGCNVAMIVTESPSLQARAGQIIAEKPMNLPFCITGCTVNSVKANCARLLSYLDVHSKVSLADISFNINRQSSRFLPYRFAFRCRSFDDLRMTLSQVLAPSPALEADMKITASQPDRQVILCFVGQVSAAIGLDRNLYNCTYILRYFLDQCDATIKQLQANEVRIKTMSVSMNFRELLPAMGVVPNDEGHEITGTDSAGIVIAIGSNVTNVSVGDRVMALSVEDTSYTTTLQLPSHLCARIPNDCSFEDASTLPTVYLTVLRTLREKASPQYNQSVLIHSAAGGVGVAAIHYAKWVGAKVYATVSSPEKTAFLVEKMGVMKENIFYSRDSTFLDAVMKATGGQGVNIVLNSLSGEQLHASWQCVAQGGSMIEIGKRDLLGRGQLAMNSFLANRSYIGVDIATLPSLEPEWVQKQLATIVDLYNQGVLHPIRPVTTFPASNVEDAFRYLQKGQHMGKLVLQFSNSSNLPVVPKIPALELRADRAYHLVGGMRGIGASISRWMVSHGAKNLVFLSRSAGETNEDKALVRELSDTGCQTLTFAGDVADLTTVQHVVSSVAVPIAGVIQLAMVLADTGVMDMDLEKWDTAVKPKVNGTWNLHEALPTDLDFFVMASSLSGTFGNYGQSNYAAANTFLDAFAQFRQGKGLAASTVDLGVVDEIGFVSRDASVHRSMVQQMSAAISEQSLLDCFHLAIVRSRPSNDLSQSFKPLDGFRSDNQLLHGLLSKTGIDKGNSCGNGIPVPL